MCGIVGFLGGEGRFSPDEIGDRVGQAIARLRHRGPDDQGSWTDPAAGLTLGHTRLAVLDLSPAGAQPMSSADGRFTLVYNGEIYNFRELRQELEAGGHPFRGHSDTEVLLEAIARWGIRPTLDRLNGMFAFALWDRADRTLTLARDRMGEKPLYYGSRGGCFAFASELKALRVLPGFDLRIRRDALLSFLRFGYVPAPLTIDEGIAKLPPGHYVSIPVDRLPLGEASDSTPYWTVRDAAVRGAAARFNGRPEEAVERIDELLRDAVRLRLEADVPLGAFLSGGVDSSVIVALMRAVSSSGVRSFTVGHEGEDSEARDAAAIARHLGTDHTEIHVTADEALGAIPRLPYHFDEPFGDPSMVPTLLISETVRRHVTVALSGDGGDELFAGYDRIVWGRRIWNRIRTLPRPLRSLAAAVLEAVPPGAAAWAARAMLSPRPGGRELPDLAVKLRKLASLLPSESADAMYFDLVSAWKEPARLVTGTEEAFDLRRDRPAPDGFTDATDRMLYWDMVTALPDQMLVKVDRASMAASLEVRVPLLDHRLVEFAWSLPLDLKIRENRGKWILRQVLDRYVPRALVDRPKTGFRVPLGEWLRGPMRDWAEALLAENRLRSEGFFNPAPIRALWADHLRGRPADVTPLWSVLMFEAWLEAARSGRS